MFKQMKRQTGGFWHWSNYSSISGVFSMQLLLTVIICDIFDDVALAEFPWNRADLPVSEYLVNT